MPQPRTGCGVATDGSHLYVFGGKTDASRLNDLWRFSLSDFKWSRLSDEGEVPAVRNGHSMNYHEGSLYVFGGIHDITWELDDLHIYSLSSQKWTTLEHDSPRKLEKKPNPSVLDSEKEKNEKKKNYYENLSGVHRGSSPLSHHRASSPLSVSKHNFSHSFGEEVNKGDSSPGKMLEEQKKKVFMQKKAEMLKNF